MVSVASSPSALVASSSPLVLLLTALLALSLSLLAAATARRAPRFLARRSRVSPSLGDCVGATPLLELTSLSAATGCRILAKCEQMEAFGSIKDRPVAAMLADAEARGLLCPGALLVEPTGGNTGLSLAALAIPRGYRLHLTVPSGVSEDKLELLRSMGAVVTECDSSLGISDPLHFVNVARSIAQAQGGVCLGQFDNLANMGAHKVLGDEIWAQCGGRVDAFVCAVGTGGTIAGVSVALKARRPSVRAYVIDPPGSGVKAFVERGVWEASPLSPPPRPGGKAEKTTVDGIGICRPTANLAAARIDGAFAGSDREAVEMAHLLLRQEGLFVGPSAGLNVAGAVKAARLLPPGSTVVTVLCDGGERYRSKCFNKAWLAAHGLTPRGTGADISFVA